MGELKLIGLTGGIASGKSAVSRAIAECGFGVIDADELSREVVEPPSEALNEIVLAFGKECLDEDGKLDRRRVAEIAFADETKRKKLEEILHPRILKLARQKAEALFERGFNPIVLEAALLVETGMYKELDGLIVVTAPLEERIRRMSARDGFSREEALKRLNAQISDGERLKRASWRLENNGSLEETTDAAKRLAENILSELGISVR